LRTLPTGLTTGLIALVPDGVAGQEIRGCASVWVSRVVVGAYSSVYIASRVPNGLEDAASGKR
jgi:preprotein translocase subunit SecF